MSLKLRSVRILITLFSFILTTSLSFAQMPPNPKLLEQIRRGTKPEPYFMQNKDILRSKGIDIPWSSPELSRQRMMKTTSRLFGAAKAPTGTWKALVILVQFTDKTSQVGAEAFDSLLFKQSPGSLWDYYKKSSYNQLDIVTVNLPSTIGWETMPNTYTYYCNGQNGFGTYPQNAQKLVEDAVQSANSVVDFSKYDNDGDGYVDALFVVHTGPGAEFTGNANDIWSHSWVTNTPQLVDGVYVYHYAMEPEYWGNPGDMTIGVFAHELGHAAFGLPDLYDTDYTSEGLGNWSLMASGSWNGPAMLGSSPALPDAWCKIQMGFETPSVITSNISGKTIADNEDNPTVYKLWKNGESGSEYFLVENRQQTSYDQYLPGNGLLIYHVDETVTTGNTQEWYPGYTSSGHYLVALEQADGQYNLEKNFNRGDSGDPYPGSEDNINFSSNTSPNSLDYNFNLTGVGVENISQSSLSMTADLNVTLTQASIVLTAPQGGITLEVGQSFQIQWSSYLISSVKLEYSTNNGTNWSTIADNVNASDGNYNWTVPNTPSIQCKVRVSNESNSSVNSVNAQPFFIVNWNTDYFVWEPINTPSSGIAIANLLQGMGVTVSYSNSSLPPRTFNYKAVFICLGVYPNNHVLTSTEAEYFVSYLKQGGNIYMEGGDTWAFDTPTPLHPYFKIAGVADGVGDLAVINGVSGTIMDGLSFNYNGENNYIDHLSPSGLANTIFRNSSPVYDCAVAYSGDTYKSVGASLEFGGLVDAGSPNTKLEVLTRLLNFFNTTSKDPTNLTANLNDLTGLVSLNWQASGVFPEIFEDFNNETADNFYMQDNRFSVSQGYLKITGTANNTWAETYYNKDFANFVCEYEFQRQDGNEGYTIGTFIRASGIIGSGTENGYLIAITVNGLYSIWNIQNGTEINIVPWSGTNAINTGLGAPNIATIIASGSNIKLYINGYYVTEINDGTFSSGKIGLCTYDASSSNNIVWWDFFSVDENVQNITSRIYPKAQVSLVGGGTAADAPNINLRSNSIPAVRLLTKVMEKSSDAAFQYFNIYRDNNKIDTTSETHYADLLSNYGTYNYKVTAQYNDHESNPAGPVSVDYSKKLNLTFPTGGLTFKAGSSKKITWTSEAIDTIKIELSTNNGTNWTTVANSVYAVPRFYMWTVPAAVSNQCKIRISDIHNPSVNSSNQDPFSIILHGILTEIEPNNTMAQAMEVSYEDADTVNASISPVNDIDYFKINGNAGDTLMIYAENRNSSQLDGNMSLLDQDGNYINEYIQGFTGNSFKQRYVYVIPNTAAYYIRYSYWGNMNGMPKKVNKRISIYNHKNPKPNLLEGAPYDQGDYFITFNYFKKSAPLFGYSYLTDLNFNSTRFFGQIYPNGLDTKITIDYGTTTSYGNSLVVTTNANSLNEWNFTTDKINGFQANTQYHYRITIQNVLGADTSNDYLYTTPSTPYGWVAENSGTTRTLYDVDFLNENNGVAVSDYNEILKTTDGGATWTNIFPSGQGYLYGGGIDYVTSNKIVAVGNPILISNDGGVTWGSTWIGNWFQSKVSFIDENNGLIVSQGGNIYKTTDGGISWNEKYNANYGAFGWSIDYFNSTVAVAAGGNGYVLKTTDGGETWTDVYSLSNWPLGVDVIDSQTYVICGSQFFAKTTDGGTSWTTQNPDGYFYDIKFTDANNGRMVGDEGQIWSTKNGGATWTQELSGTYNTLYGIANTTQNSSVVVGDWGTILHRTFSNHFTKDWINPYSPMNIYVTSASVNGVNLDAGDEIAVFDGNNCVGVSTLSAAILPGSYIQIIASTDDPTTTEVDGFVPGDTITFKFWDKSKTSEITNITADYASGNGKFSSLGSATVGLTGIYTIAQDIALNNGWNIFSLMVTPDNLSMLELSSGTPVGGLLYTLANSGTLVKAQNESGNAVENVPGIGWVNNIGEWSATEGYYIRVNANCNLDITGPPVSLPINIPLGDKWNIISYPVSTGQDAMTVLEPLITSNQLVKVQDEEGNAIENIPGIGWINNIGNFMYNEGYYLRANTSTTLTIDEPPAPSDKKESKTKPKSMAKTTGNHFVPIYISPYVPMNFYVTSAKIEGDVDLGAGDEIGVFDGENCVGAIKLTGPISNYVTFIASTDDPTTPGTDGFIPGHAISYKFWLTSKSQEDSAYTVNYAAGDGTFSSLGTAVVSFVDIIPLPVELETFTANVMESRITLNWETSTEVNNYGFEIERSVDNSSWTKIGFVIGSGKSQSTKRYSYYDNDAVGGSKFKYRLKQIDNDGKYDYSKEIEVEIVPKEYTLYQNYPNPFNPTTTVRYSLPRDSHVKITIYNSLGQEIEVLVDRVQPVGYYNQMFNARNLSCGVYFYSIYTKALDGSKAYRSIKKMLLLK